MTRLVNRAGFAWGYVSGKLTQQMDYVVGLGHGGLVVALAWLLYVAVTR